MKNINLEFLKYQENNTPFHAPRHNHTCNELVYYISGNGVAKLGEQVYSYYPNTFLLIPPEIDHEETAYTDTCILFI